MADFTENPKTDKFSCGGRRGISENVMDSTKHVCAQKFFHCFSCSLCWEEKTFSSLFSIDVIKGIWSKIRRDEPELLSNFEEFLGRVTGEIKRTHTDLTTMESALRKYELISAHENCWCY